MLAVFRQQADAHFNAFCLRRNNFLRCLCNSTLRSPDFAFDIRQSRGGLLLDRRALTASSRLVEGRKTRFSRILVGVFSEVLVERDRNIVLLQAIVSAQTLAPFTEESAGRDDVSYSLKSTESHSSNSSAFRIFCSQLDAPDILRNADVLLGVTQLQGMYFRGGLREAERTKNVDMS
jgi:hypothetical protein